MPVPTPEESIGSLELPTITANLVDGMLCHDGGKLRQILLNAFRLSTWIPDQLKHSDSSSIIRCWSTGRIDITALAGQINIFDGSNYSICEAVWNAYRLIILHGVNKTYSYDDVYLQPAGSRSIWAAAFNVWSSKKLKKDITDLVGSQNRVKKLSPKKYREGEKSRQGFIAEECPQEYIEVGVDEEGNPLPALDMMAILTDLVAEVQAIRNEINALKGSRK